MLVSVASEATTATTVAVGAVAFTALKPHTMRAVRGSRASCPLTVRTAATVPPDTKPRAGDSETTCGTGRNVKVMAADHEYEGSTMPDHVRLSATRTPDSVAASTGGTWHHSAVALMTNAGAVPTTPNSHSSAPYAWSIVSNACPVTVTTVRPVTAPVGGHSDCTVGSGLGV